MPRPTTKNKVRDTEMSSVKKGKKWYFAMKAHIGVDAESCLTHSQDTTAVKVHESRVWDDMLHCEKMLIWAEEGYVSAEDQAKLSTEGKVGGVMRKESKGARLHSISEDFNWIIVMVRAKVEQPSHLVKRQFDYANTRYRGMPKNRKLLFALFALCNVHLMA